MKSTAEKGSKRDKSDYSWKEGMEAKSGGESKFVRLWKYFIFCWAIPLKITAMLCPAKTKELMEREQEFYNRIVRISNGV